MEMLTITGAANRPDVVRVDFRAGGAFVLREGIVVDGGSGTQADTLLLRGTAGADTIDAETGFAVLSGLRVVFSDVERLTLDGGSGDDTYRASGLSANTTIVDAMGPDTLDFSKAGGGIRIDLNRTLGQKQYIFASSGNTLALKGTLESLIGTESADWIRGNAANNSIEGRGGDDTVFGGAGNDTLDGGTGDDWLYGEAASDNLYGGPGNNVLLGGAGNDLLDVNPDVTSGTERNLLIGGQGADTLRGGSGVEILIGGGTKYGSQKAALDLILKEWSSESSFEVRCTNLQTGIADSANPKLGNIQLARTTTMNRRAAVPDDAASDVLLGGLGSDWFFDFPNDTTDRGPEDR